MISHNVVVIYHRKSNLFHCFDGLFSAYPAYKNFPNALFLAGTHFNNDEIINKIGLRNDVFVVDYSLKTTHIDELKSRGNSVMIIDHHKSFWDELSTLKLSKNEYKFDFDKSGCVLSWEYFSPNSPVPEIFKYIQTGDLYKFTLPDAKTICAGIYEIFKPLGFYEAMKKIEEYLHLSQLDLRNFFYDEGAAAKLKRDIRVKEYCKKAESFDFVWCEKTCKIKTVDVDRYDLDIVSTIGSRLYNDEQIDFSMMVCDGNDGFIYVSLRSNGFDCEPIAKKYGGGGHKQACGFKVKHLSEIEELSL